VAGVTAAVLAVCSSCPAEATASDAVALIPLMDEHTNSTGHRLWAVSSVTHPRRNR